MTNSVEDIKKKIRENGLKSTMTRVAVFQHLFSSSKPCSHTELVQSLDERYGDQATIYRTLLSFVEKGIARIASQAGGIARYELVKEGETAQHVHPHFICDECGEVSCLPKTTVITQVDEQWQEILKQAKLQFIGFCLDCQK